MIPTLIGVTLIVFLLSHAGGINELIGAYLNPHVPEAVQRGAIIRELGLNKPVYIQYLDFLVGLFRGDWGYTHTPVFTGPVTSAILIFFPNTIELAIFGFLLTLVMAIPVGTYAAIRKDRAADHVSRIISFIGYSFPAFFLAEIVAVYLGTREGIQLLPISGTLSGGFLGSVSWISSTGISYPTHLLLLDALIHGDLPLFWNALKHLILPALVLAFTTFAGLMRYMRSSMVEVMNMDYVKFAKAKGLSESRINSKYIRRNALIPFVTVSGLTLASYMGGVVVIEVIFNYPGIGYWLYEALINNDAGGILAGALLFAIILVTANLVVDVIYAYLDPRIRLGE
ncbi:MAG: ABC transporter permease [Candidatus Parvarchaeota archaeon]